MPSYLASIPRKTSPINEWQRRGPILPAYRTDSRGDKSGGKGSPPSGVYRKNRQAKAGRPKPERIIARCELFERPGASGWPVGIYRLAGILFEPTAISLRRL